MYLFEEFNLLKALAETDLRNDPETKRADLELGMTKKQQARAICSAIAQLPISDENLLEIATYYSITGKLRLNDSAILELMSDTNSFFPVGTPHPGDLISSFENHDSLISQLISPSSNSEVEYHLLYETLSPSNRDHALALDNLRHRSERNSDQFYQWLMCAKFSKLLRAIRNNNAPGHYLDDLVHTARDHARCLAVGLAHHKTAIVRAHSKDPMGSVFSGFKEWKTGGETIKACVVAPANKLQLLDHASRDPEIKFKNFDETITHLRKQNILDDSTESNNLSRLIKLINEFYARMSPAQKRDEAGFAARLSHMAKSAEALSRLRQGHMKLAGFDKQSFTELRYKVTPSEAAAFIAMSLLQAFADIDREFGLKPVKRPAAQHSDYSQNQLYFMTTLLRAESQPDKNAAMIGGMRQADGGIDRSNKGSTEPVHGMQEKIEDPEVRDKLQWHLGFSVHNWFK